MYYFLQVQKFIKKFILPFKLVYFLTINLNIIIRTYLNNNEKIPQKYHNKKFLSKL